MSDDGEFEFVNDYEQNEQEMNPIESYNAYIDAREETIVGGNNCLQEFVSMANSEFNIIKITAFMQLPTLILNFQREEFETQAYSMLLKFAATQTPITSSKISSKAPSIQNLLRGDFPIANEITRYIQDFFIADNVSIDEMNYIIKQIIIEQSVDILDSIVKLYNTTNQQQYFSTQTYCKFAIKYILPLLLAVIKSSVCVQQINRAYDLLNEVNHFLFTKFNESTKTKKHIFDKSKLSHAHINQQQIEDEKISKQGQQVLDTYFNIMAGHFIIVPYLKCQMFLFKNQLDQQLMLQLFEFKTLDNNKLFNADIMYILNELTFPIEEGYEIDINYSPLDIDYRAQLIENEFRVAQQMAAYHQEIILNNCLKIKQLSPEIISVIITILCRHLSGRAIHKDFIISVLDILQPTISHDYQQHSQNNLKIISKIYEQLKQVQCSLSEYSLRQSESINQNESQTIIRVLCLLLSKMKRDKNYEGLLTEVINIIITEQNEHQKQIMSYCLASFLPVITIEQQQSVLQYYYNNLKSTNKTTVQHFVKNLGPIIEICNELLIDNYENLAQCECLKQIVELAYKFIKGNVETTFFNIQINNHTKFKQNVTMYLTNSISAIFSSYTIINMSNSLITQEIKQQYSVLFKNIKTKYSLYNQYIHKANNFINIFNPQEFSNLFITAIQENNQTNILDIVKIVEQFPINLHELLDNNKLHQILCQQLQLVTNNVDFSTMKTQTITYNNQQFMIYVDKKLVTQGQITPNYVKIKIPEQVTINNNFQTISCQDYKNRLTFAEELPQMIYRICKLISKDELFKVFYQVIDVLLCLVFDPVRKVRTTIMQKMGVLIGLFINEDTHIPLIIDTISMILNIQVTDDKQLSQLLQNVKKTKNNIQTCSIQLKCEIIRMMYYICLTSKLDPFKTFGNVFVKLAQSEIVVISTLAEHLCYLAINNNPYVFGVHYQNLFKYWESIKIQDQTVKDFSTKYMNIVERHNKGKK
ncbi:Conserved_hypothetical protein [Hexamita inflata]|uniref:Uncharacterized protein n=1 Tax=Hexamita inflata TaxID=28002 RepID=A0AA86PLP9_9EUKA|nr:Conserved hypothetical protein [Hexamita inflata]